MSRRRAKPEKRAPAALAPAVGATPPAPPRPPSRVAAALVRFGVPLAVALLVAAGFALRVIPAMPHVFPAEGEVRYFDPDSYYHVRHARYAAEHGFRLQRWDPSVYPAGAAALYAGVLDLGIAAIARIAGGGTASRELLEGLAPWVPATLGALAILVAYLLGRAAHGWLAGLLAALFLTIFGGTFLDRSMLGFVDHHVLEALLGLLVVLGLTRLMREQRGERPPPWWRPAALRALPMAVFLFSWYGAPIYVVLVVVTLFVAGTVEILRDGDARATAVVAFRWFAGVAVVALPVVLVAPWMVMDGRMLTWAAAGAALVMVGLPAYLLALARLIARGVPRAAAALGGLAAGAGAFLLLPRLVPQVASLQALLLGEKTTFVQEQASAGLLLWWQRSGPVLVLACLALPLALLDAWRRRDAASRLPLATMGTLVIALWFRTNDYDYAASAFTPVLGALGLALGADLLPPRRRAVGVAAALAALAALFFPLRLAAPRWPAQQRMEAAMHLEEGVVGALRFLRDRGAPLAQPLGELSPRGRFRHPPGNYGVMSFWDLGHYVAAIADRPAVAIGALAVDTAQWFLIEDEEESLRALAKGLEPGEERRYIVVDARTAADVFGTIVRMTGGNERDYAEPFAKGEAADGKKVPLYTYGPRFRRSMLYRLFHDPSDLSRYRLVYASPQKHALAYVATPVPTGMSVTRRAFSLDDPRAARNWQAMKTRGGIVRQGSAFMYDIVITSTARVYERVAGARIAGTAAPGARVEARLTLRARATALEVPYRRQGVAGPDGAFELVVPYPAGGTPPGDSDVGAREAYEIFVDGQPAGRAVVSLDDVRGGRVVKLRPR